MRQRRANGVQPEAGPRGDEEHRDGPVDAGELGRGCGRVRLEVGLRQDHDRSCAALHGEPEVALEEARVELLAERMDDERDVDVRRDHLLARHA